MRVVLQRVSSASVTVDEKIVGAIQKGLLVLVGIEDADTQEDIDWLVTKITQLRIFGSPTPALPEGEGVKNDVMNFSVQDVNGDVLVVSQFTLHAATKKGNRPSYIKASKPEVAIPLYEKFVIALENKLGKKVPTGIFGADMKVAILNDGPVTIVIDSKNKE
jgi:D-tyrosyl-tRNA(Tyr) deacylase